MFFNVLHTGCNPDSSKTNAIALSGNKWEECALSYPTEVA